MEKSNELIKDPINWEGIRNENIEELKERLKTMDKTDLEKMLIVLESKDVLLQESNNIPIFLGILSFILGLAAAAISILNHFRIINSFGWIIAIVIFLLILGYIFWERKRTSYRKRNSEIISIKIAVKELINEINEEERRKENKKERKRIKEERGKIKNKGTRREIRRVRRKGKKERKTRNRQEDSYKRRHNNVIDDEILSYNWRG
ncbi:MAG TPA: hypothetical protein VK087_01395 [Tissierellaceae bacterium]|nr:hypothetical protein [Tissierellaceae bacterium]